MILFLLEIIQCQSGIIGVVCRSQADLNANKEVTAAMEAERRFLTKKYPSLASRLGTCYLRRQLHLLLLRHIRECLPNIAMKINVLKVRCSPVEMRKNSNLSGNSNINSPHVASQLRTSTRPFSSC